VEVYGESWGRWRWRSLVCLFDLVWGYNATACPLNLGCPFPRIVRDSEPLIELCTYVPQTRLPGGRHVGAA
jgi:hypothetical protein